MIETLTLTLAASPSYKSLRDKLRGISVGQTGVSCDSKEKFFLTLYKTWCYNPISTITLCLMSRNYELAFNLIPRFT
jgi:vacuole morphology and inheritance protein 14